MTDIGLEDVKTLEQIRQRMQTVNSSFNALLSSLQDSQPLPTWCVGRESPIFVRTKH